MYTFLVANVLCEPNKYSNEGRAKTRVFAMASTHIREQMHCWFAYSYVTERVFFQLLQLFNPIQDKKIPYQFFSWTFYKQRN